MRLYKRTCVRCGKEFYCGAMPAKYSEDPYVIQNHHPPNEERCSTTGDDKAICSCPECAVISKIGEFIRQCPKFYTIEEAIAFEI